MNDSVFRLGASSSPVCGLANPAAERVHNKLGRFNQKAHSESWGVELHFDPTEPAQRRGIESLDKNADMALPICMNYNSGAIYRLLRFALEFSDRIQIFTTDGPAVYDYTAVKEALIFGDHKIKAKSYHGKAHLDGNRLRNLCDKKLLDIRQALKEEAEGKAVEFLHWENIYKDPHYREAEHYINALYRYNDVFRTDIDTSARTYVTHQLSRKLEEDGKLEDKDKKYKDNKLHDPEFMKRAVNHVLWAAVQYPIEELAMLLAYDQLRSPIADHGRKGFNYLCIDSWPVLQGLITGKYDNPPKENIGYVNANIRSLNGLFDGAGGPAT